MLEISKQKKEREKMDFGEEEKFLQFVPSSREIHMVYAATLGTNDTQAKPGIDAELLREPVVGWITVRSTITIEGNTVNFEDVEPVTWSEGNMTVERINYSLDFLGLEFDGKRKSWRDETTELRERKERAKKIWEKG